MTNLQKSFFEKPYDIALFVDNEELLEHVRKSLKSTSLQTILYKLKSLDDLIEAIEGQDLDIIFLHLTVADTENLEWLKRIAEIINDIPLVAICDKLDDKTERKLAYCGLLPAKRRSKPTQLKAYITTGRALQNIHPQKGNI
jgi:DNA-binding NtrC family response regulator